MRRYPVETGRAVNDDSTPPGGQDVDDVTIRHLVAENTALAKRLSRRYAHSYIGDEDLEQVAMIGLLLAARRYNPDTGLFRPYAVATISGELKKHLRNTGWAVRVSRRVQERSITVERSVDQLTQRLGRSPTPAEIGSEVGLSTDEVLAAIKARDARFGADLTGADRSSDDSVLDLTDKVSIETAVDRLSDEQRELLRLRYLVEMTQRQIGAELGMSQPQVHRRLNALHRDLRSYLDDVGYRP